MFIALFYVTKKYLNPYFSKWVLYPIKSMWHMGQKNKNSNPCNQPGTSSEHVTQTFGEQETVLNIKTITCTILKRISKSKAYFNFIFNQNNACP